MFDLVAKTIRHSLRSWLLIAPLLLFCAGHARGADTASPLILAVIPYLPEQIIRERFQPLAEYLSKALGRAIVIRIGTDYEEHTLAIGKGQVDIAFIGSAGYVKLVERYGPFPLLARLEVNGKPELYSVIAARADSKFHTLKDLARVRFAFGDKDSTTGHVMPRYMLARAGIPHGAPPRHEYLGTHTNVAMAVMTGDFQAGALKKEVFDQYAGKGLRAIAVSPPISTYPFLASATMPAKEVATLRQALLKLKAHPDGPAILNKMQLGLTGLVPVSDKDYDPLRAMMREIAADLR